jgi:hypothetical protein
MKRPIVQNEFLTNSGIAELLAIEAETAKQPLQKLFVELLVGRFSGPKKPLS